MVEARRRRHGSPGCRPLTPDRLLSTTRRGSFKPAAPGADCWTNELRSALLPAPPHRPGRVRPAPQGARAAGHARGRLRAPDRGARAAHAGGHRARGARDARRPRQARASSPTTARSTSPTRSPAWRASASTPSASAARSRSSSARSRSRSRPSTSSMLPAGHPLAGRGGARDRAAHRHHRLGQVHDAGRDDRPHQQHAPRHIVTVEDPIEFLHSTRSRSSTSARSAWTPCPSSARCAASCARTPT